jgi:ferredoxin-thioredoxin reductase catalytic subunit
MAHRVYVDTSVLVFFFITNFDPKFSKASKEFFTRVESGKYEGMISLFALIELIKQLRELLVRANICMPKDWEEATKKAIEAIYKMQNIKTKRGTRNMTPITIETTRARAEADANTYGYHLTPDPELLQGFLEGLKVNEERYGYPSCPCRLASGKFEFDRDIICPCDYRDPDVAE